MRITAEEKTATRQRILEAATALFRRQGFDATTTRDIAQAARIAAGTLFNYFPTKEAIVGVLAEVALTRARGEVQADGSATFEESLFALVAAELRRLKPHRKYIAALLDTSLSPLAIQGSGNVGEGLRIGHLEIVASLARRHGLESLSPVALQLYWTLYTGVLAYWAADKSPRQEDTLALLDQSLSMFAGWLGRASGETT